MSADARFARIVARFESLSADDVARLGDIYGDDAHFKDPFNDARGLPAVQRVFTHMFATLDDPRFVVQDVLVDGARAFVTWDFAFRIRGTRALRSIHGGSLLTLGVDGRLSEHLDYWDSADLFGQLPLLRSAVRWLKRRAGGERG